MKISFTITIATSFLFMAKYAIANQNIIKNNFRGKAISPAAGSTSSTTTSEEQPPRFLEELQMPTTEKDDMDMGDICLSQWQLNTNACNIDGILEQLQELLDDNGCPHEAEMELIMALDVDTFDQVELSIHRLCTKAITEKMQQSNQYNGHLDDLVFTKAFYDGGTYMNDMRQTRQTSNGEQHVLQDNPGEWIRAVYEDVAHTRTMEFPSMISNFDDCELRAAMCCWVQDRQANDDNGDCEKPYDENCINASPADNTNICLVDFERAPQSSRVEGGFALFPGESEGDTHCHGFAWSEDESDLSNVMKGNNLFYVSFYDHLLQRGYVKEVPGAPMCGCVEQMPIVTRSDCTQVDIGEDVSMDWQYAAADDGLTVTVLGEAMIDFNACTGIDDNDNDLAAHYELMVLMGMASVDELEVLLETVVGPENCGDTVEKFLEKNDFRF